MKIQTQAGTVGKDEEFARQMADIMRRFSDGEQLQSCSKNNQGTVYSEWTNCNRPSWSFDFYDYRIKPSSETQPLSIDDMVPGIYFKSKNSPTSIYLSTGFRQDGVIINFIVYSYVSLFRDWLWSTDLKTWNPCSKIVE